MAVVGRHDYFSNSVDSSESAALGKGEEYAKKKVPKLKKEIETLLLTISKITRLLRWRG